MARGAELNDRERLFVREYLIDLNAARAAIRAGYSLRSAPKQASRVFNRARVKAAIEVAMAERATKLEITADKPRSLEPIGKQPGMFARKAGEDGEEEGKSNVKLSGIELAHRLLGEAVRRRKGGACVAGS